MLGDDPDTTVAPVRVGFGEVFGRTPEGGRCTVQKGVFGLCDRIGWLRSEWGFGGLTKEVRLGLVIG